MSIEGYIAATRFGLGARLQDGPVADPRGWLLGQLQPPEPLPGLTLAQCLASMRAGPLTPQVESYFPATLPVPELFRQETMAWGTRMLTSPTPFLERLAEFWGNHFTTSRQQGNVTSVAGHYHRAIIRPRILGRFEDLLLAAARHPALLIYLDANSSIGPNSPNGRHLRRGLNENLAREMMELHTLGVDGGYSQGDVSALAAILTGWSVGRGPQYNEPDDFMFRQGNHEPGPKTLLGQVFPEGEAGGIAALKFLANHQSTHQFLATKLVRHFVADEPPPSVVRRIAQVLADTGGNLGAATRVLVTAPEAWAQPLSKLRSPQDYAIAVYRGMGLGEQAAPLLLGILGFLGQPLWIAPAPNGWPDTAAGWASPESIMRRLSWAGGMANAFFSDTAQAGSVAQATLGPLLPTSTARAIAGTTNPREALLLLLASPEFQRR